MTMPAIPYPLITFIVGTIIGASSTYLYFKNNELQDKVKVEQEYSKINENNTTYTQEAIDGWHKSFNRLNDRLDGKWVPNIPRKDTLPVSPDSSTTCRNDAGTTIIVPDPTRDFGKCDAERKRLIEDGAKTTLQLVLLKEWIKGVQCFKKE